MQTQLMHEEWQRLSRFFIKLSELPTQDITAKMSFLLQSACELTHAQQCVAIMAVREPSALTTKAQRVRHVAQTGWRPYTMYYHNVPEEVIKASQAFSRTKGAVLEEGVKMMTRQAGAHRVYLASDMGLDFTKHPPPNSMMAIRASTDRLVGVHSFSQNIEIFFCLDRTQGATHFTKRERDMLFELIKMLRPLVYRLSLSLGLFVNEGMSALTARESEALLQLLGPDTEKEMALKMGITSGSMHQYVNKVYTKLNVNSRAELTSLWLDIPALDPSEL